MQVEGHDVIVIGGGQAGLAASHHLARRGIEHVVLDAGSAVGETWRRRWDSLRLFTPAAMDGLPGMPFPADAATLPTRVEMADYLATYADRDRTPIRLGVTVDALARADGGFLVSSRNQRFTAPEVIVATGFLTTPYRPEFASGLDPSIVQLHSDDYRNPASLSAERVLLVGAGNSGVEIAMELARAGRQVVIAGHSTFLPRIATIGGGRAFFSFARRALTLETPLGRRMRDRMGTHGSAPVIRVRPADLSDARVHRVERVQEVRHGRPVLANGRTLDVDAVVWCTGFRPGFDWIRLPILEPSGLPRHDRGAATGMPGLSFVGLPFQRSFLSPLVGGVGPDAEVIVDAVVNRLAEPPGVAVAAGSGAIA